MSSISEVTGAHKWPKRCCFPLRGPNHSLRSQGATGSSTVPGNRHGPLCVTSDLVPGTVFSTGCALSERGTKPWAWRKLHSLFFRDTCYSVNGITWQHYHYLQRNNLVQAHIPYISCRVNTEVSHLSKASWSLTVSLQMTESSNLRN